MPPDVPVVPKTTIPVEPVAPDPLEVPDKTPVGEELNETEDEDDLPIDNAFDESEPIRNENPPLLNVGGGQSLPPVVPAPPVAQTATEEKKRMFNEKVKKLRTQRFLPKSITADEVKELFDLLHDGIIDGKNADAVADVLKTVILNGVFKNEPKTLKDYITQFITACPKDKQEAVADVLKTVILNGVFKNEPGTLKGYIEQFMKACPKDKQEAVADVLKTVILNGVFKNEPGTLKGYIEQFMKACPNDLMWNVASVLEAAIESNKFDSNWLNVRISEFIDAYDKNDDDDHNFTIVLILTKAIEKDLDIKYLGNLKNRIPKFITFCLNKKEDIAANASLIIGVLSVAIKNNLLNQELYSQVQQIDDNLEQRRAYYNNDEQIIIKKWLDNHNQTV